MVKWNGPFRSDRSNRKKRSTSKGGPLFSKRFRLDRTDPLSFRPKFPEIWVEWIAPFIHWVDSVNIPVGPLQVFALSGHMVRNKLCWDANNAVGFSKQRKVRGLVWYEFLCYGSPTAIFFRPSIIYSIPCDWMVHRAYSWAP